MFIVVTNLGDEHDTKAFRDKKAAVSFANNAIEDGADSADLYEIGGVEDAREAKSALELGQAILVWQRRQSHAHRDYGANRVSVSEQHGRMSKKKVGKKKRRPARTKKKRAPVRLTPEQREANMDAVWAKLARLENRRADESRKPVHLTEDPSPSRSVRAVSGGLPSLGKRR